MFIHVNRELTTELSLLRSLADQKLLLKLNFVDCEARQHVDSGNQPVAYVEGNYLMKHIGFRYESFNPA